MDEISFSRPVRWLLAMHGASVVPFACGTLCSGARTRLTRSVTGSETVTLANASEYASVMATAGIQVNVEDRRDTIWNGVVSSAEVRCSGLVFHVKVLVTPFNFL